MKVTLFKIVKKKEVINRFTLDEVAALIINGVISRSVRSFREVYHLMQTKRLDDGQIVTDLKGAPVLPRLNFAIEQEHKNGNRIIRGYNGLVVLEVNDLQSYEDAVEIRNKVSRMPQTVLAFLGGSGKSVKIVVRGELFPDIQTTPASSAQEGKRLPENEADIRQFHHNIYETARQAYQSQFQMDIKYLEPKLERTVYLSSDPEAYYNPQASPFLADMKPMTAIEPVSISRESDLLMPGRTIDRTYFLNYQFVLSAVLSGYVEIPNDQRMQELLMRLATRCFDEKIPMAIAQGMTLEHPFFRTDRLAVEMTFQNVYAIAMQEEYMQKHKFKPLKSVPEDTIQAMRTEIFLNSNYDMRKNLLTGVAEYREKYSDDQTYKPLTEEVRNDMTLKATELGLKSWDRNVNRFIDSTRIEQYDPVNTWLDGLPQWDGHDYIADLAARVPTDQPHWEKYLRMWLIAMVAQWRESKKQLTGNALTPLLIGRQGCGKTRFCKIILPEELRDYYNDKINFKNEFDLNIALTSFALINIDEFDKTTNSQQIVLKYLLSSSDVKFRPPYGKTIKQYRRYTSFIGTTNQQKPLADPTGSRRFVCVGVTGNINFEDNLNHRQLFAQAHHLFKAGERFWLNDDEIATLIMENEPYQKLNDLVEMISETFRKPKAGEQARWWSLEDIRLLLSNHYANFDPKTSFIKIGRALSDQQFGFESRRTNTKTEYRIVER